MSTQPGDSVYRVSKLQPWYHMPLPRCDAVIKSIKEQCIYSARYTDSAGKGINLCKIHADMADFKTKLIRTQRIQAR